MKIDYDGTVYEFDQEDITLKQAMSVQLHSGMSIAEWQNSLDIEEITDPATGEKTMANPGPEWLKSVQCLYWVVLAQNGVVEPIADADFKVAKFLTAYAEAVKAEQAAEAPEPEDPTKASPSPGPSPEPPSLTPPSALPEVVAPPTVS